MVEITVEILRPVHPGGVSFIRYIYGAVAAQNRNVIEKHKKEFTKLITRLGIKIEEAVGTDKLITGKVILELEEDDKPKRISIEDVKVWEVTKEYKEKITAEL